ncbi:MAG TPA: SIS domain-containing protein [Candidatus Merdisoma faecalis]|uniref:SIS domain-containing protein n=1 Tax=Lachnoclostridium sp. An138 TaxID=1965560 RepID=UPI000B36D604|nr:SIS domain-containing protein [Lachnoclostridium sp. An138]OUQ17958.1 adhesin [Lachnoclostridium sp. An138]HIR98266.1 SIS domain-containing protein [Candidatus Merdisoma faecalis]
MSSIFGITEEKMQETSSNWTVKEIYQQPATWEKTCRQIEEHKDEIQKFIDQVITQEDFDVILTGAGTSEFVGNALFPHLTGLLNYKVKSYGTTDIVATPEAYLSRTKPTLLISFGRSGNSPESIGAVDAAESVCDNLYHLFVTCNKDGALSKRAESTEHCYAINLTPETHDQSFAMTSSFSNMYLATYLCFHLNELDKVVAEVRKIAAAGQNFLDNQYSIPQTIVNEYDFNRIVYLGSNTLKGTSQESALKMLELTAGRVVTMYDTPLGFRHGPKSIIDDNTLTVVYLSDDAYTRQYEIDLIKEMSGQRKGNRIVAVMSKTDEAVAALVDYTVVFGLEENHENVQLGLDYILFAQTLAVLKSLSLSITPDNPCPTGEVNRVVKGVTLYPYTRK